MLEQIESLSLDTCNMIILVKDARLQSFVSQKIKDHFNIGRNLTKYVNTGAELKQVKSETFVPPFGGGRWYVNVNADKIKIGEIGKALGQIYTSALTVYWVTNYVQFKKIISLDIVEKQGYFCKTMYLNKLYPEDITYFHNNYVPTENYLNREVLNYLKKNYTFDVDSICDVFERTKNGEVFKNSKDIISQVGIGGNTISKFVIKTLTSNPKTEKGAKKSLSNLLILFNDLSYSYNYSTLKNFFKDNLRTILEIKQLQQMGLFTLVRQEIPETGYSTEKIQKFSRFYKEILEKITTARVLNLLILLERTKYFDPEYEMVTVLTEYLRGIYTFNEKNPESKEIMKSKRYR